MLILWLDKQLSVGGDNPKETLCAHYFCSPRVPEEDGAEISKIIPVEVTGPGPAAYHVYMHMFKYFDPQLFDLLVAVHIHSPSVCVCDKPRLDPKPLSYQECFESCMRKHKRDRTSIICSSIDGSHLYVVMETSTSL